MAKVTWFEAYENWDYDDGYRANSNNFLDLIIKLGDKAWDLPYTGKVYVVSVDTDLDGLPHSTLMCGFSIFRTEKMFGQVDMTERMANFIDEISSESEQTIYDSFTWDDEPSNFVLITHSDYDYDYEGDE